MIYSISNEKLHIDIDSFGAELTRIVSADGIEYLCPDEKLNWDGKSPVLFPNTGVKNGGLQHGFAKRMEFKAAEHAESFIVFELESDPETLKLYPYQFSLRICYRLIDDVLNVCSVVENTGTDDLYFSLGFHPAISCPLLPGENAEDYVFRFDEPVYADRIILQDGYAADLKKKFWNGISEFPVREGMFDGGSYSMANFSGSSVEMLSKKSGRAVKLIMGDYPNLVLWAPKYEKITNICIEPWYGQPDRVEGDADPAAKPFSICVPAKQSKKLDFELRFL